MDRKLNRKKLIDEFAFYSDKGLRFAVVIIVFLFLGNWLDNKFEIKPVFTLVCVFLGASAGFYSLYRSLVSDAKKKHKK